MKSLETTSSGISRKMESLFQASESFSNRGIMNENDSFMQNFVQPPKSTLYELNITNDSYEKQFDQMGNESIIQDTTTEIVMCIDSNRKYLNFRKLWSLNGTKVKFCGNMREVDNTIDNMKAHSNLKYFFISVGCNDLDTKHGDLVFNSIKSIVDKLRGKFPGIKIILSEITPRMDDLDIQVRAVNTLLNQYVNSSDDLYLTFNSNMRDPDFFYDNKHFKESCVARFAANIKRALNKAYGRQQRNNVDRKSNREKKYNYENTFTRRTNDQATEEQLPHHVKGIMSSFKDNLLRKITEAFELADF